MQADDLNAVMTWLAFSAIPILLLLLGLWFFRPGVQRWELPPQRNRRVPWRGLEIVFLFGLIDIFLPMLIFTAVRESRLLTLVYGSEFAENSDLVRSREAVWGALLMLPLAVSAIVGTLALASGTRPYQLGLHTKRLGKNAWVGVLAWLTFTPILLLLWLTLGWLLKRFGHSGNEDHSLTTLGLGSNLILDRVMLVFTAVMAAPILEELLFRGVLQPWLGARTVNAPAESIYRQRRHRQTVVTGVAVFVAVFMRMSPLGKAVQSGEWPRIVGEAAPALFMLFLGSTFLIWRAIRGWPDNDQRADPVGAIFVSSLVFAAGHSAVWPSPVPLFLLAVVLGFLAYRTQSLVPSIVLHALFNGVACVMLFFPQ